MNKHTFTPGPWEVADDHPKRACLRVRVAGNEYAEVASLYDAPTEEESGQDDDDVWRNDPVRIANARLIASAPDLLSALRECIQYMAWNTLAGGKAHSNALAAIHKATGVDPLDDAIEANGGGTWI